MDLPKRERLEGRYFLRTLILKALELARRMQRVLELRDGRLIGA